MSYKLNVEVCENSKTKARKKMICLLL